MFYFGEKMKQCSKCKEWKELSEFYRANNKKSGYFSQCKKCANEARKGYDRSEILKKYNSSEKGRIARSQYEKTEKGKIAKKRYRQSEIGREIERKNSAAYKIRYPDRAKAHYVVKDMVKMGKIPPAKMLPCDICGNAACHYHHYKGYEKEHWLDVIPLCQQCHINIHKAMAQ